MTENINNLINFTVINYKNIMSGGGNKYRTPLKRGITIYYRDTCPYCQKLMEFVYGNFDNKNIIMTDDVYDLNNIDDNKNIIEFVNVFSKNTDKNDFLDFMKTMNKFDKNHNTFPIVFVEGDYLGGSDNFYDYYENNKKYNTLKGGNYKKYRIVKYIGKE